MNRPTHWLNECEDETGGSFDAKIAVTFCRNQEADKKTQADFRSRRAGPPEGASPETPARVRMNLVTAKIGLGKLGEPIASGDR